MSDQEISQLESGWGLTGIELGRYFSAKKEVIKAKVEKMYCHTNKTVKDTVSDIVNYDPEEVLGIQYNSGPNVKGDDGGKSHFLIKAGDVGILYNAYRNHEFIGQYQVYIRDGKQEIVWFYEQ